MPSANLRICLAFTTSLMFATFSSVQADEGDVTYSRDILPLLADRCFLCHGPDEGTRESEFRLDIREEATRNHDGLFAIKPGDPDASELLNRISTNDEDLLMPPPDSGKEPLSAEEVARIRKWIKADANYSQHWAFVPPKRPKLPQIKQSDWGHNPIDAFVLARLEQAGIVPSPRADRVTLLRRLSLDLIGLPPTIEEIETFLEDESPDAYEKQVRRLLASSHYGERWGRIWLDAARYADSDGFEKDKPREVWFYRDWVINSLNRDLPYDQFIIEQIAGDLLPNATQDQKVATGFLRNSMLNEEGGIDPEEFRMQAMFDRMDAIGKAILGFTVQCAQCHSHKYDPLSKRDYYEMFAFLNNSHEAQPTVYTSDQLEKRKQTLQQIAEIELQLKADNPEWIHLMEAWEKSVEADLPEWTVLPIENAGSGTQRYLPQGDGSLLAQGYAPTRFDAPFSAVTDLAQIRSVRLEAMLHPNLPAGGPGRGYDGQFALTEFTVKAESIQDPKQNMTAKFVKATADFGNEHTELGAPYVDDAGKSSGTIGPIEYAIDGDKQTAWGIDAGPGRRNQQRNAVFVTDKNIAFPGGTKLTFTISQRQGGSNSNNNETLNLGRFRISVASEEAVADPVPNDVREILFKPMQNRTAYGIDDVFSYWRTTVPEWKETNEKIESLWQEHPEGTTQFTLQERRDPRATYLLDRGDFLKPVEQVSASVPEFLHKPSRNSNRLDFARWLVDAQSPTTARSIVNRIWQAYFGIGIVDTPEDLGSQGGLPSHPELLDWLAIEFMENDWSLKHLHNLIVTSATYQQSSAIRSDVHADDPANRLLSRGARFRVDAEIVRDIFLAASGLLNRKVGGRSVYPPAPEFLFRRPVSYGQKNWAYDTDEEKYRRAIYTFRFRSVPYPALQTFDAPSGEISTVKRSRSNTPLQALTTLNEDLFVECARTLAKRVLTEGGEDDKDRLQFVFRSCVARQPTDAEAKLLLDVYQQQFQRFEKQGTNPLNILGETNSDENYHPSKLAAWTVVSRIVLNLDETITRE